MRGQEKAGVKWSALLLCLVITLAGCSTKIAFITPLPARDRSVAEQKLRNFVEQPCPPAVDADVRLRWDVLGYDGSVDGMLQIQPPAYLRFTIVDPLGRTLFILASDGKQYTAIDGRIGKAYIGDTSSGAWQKYIGQLDPTELFSLLGGRIPEKRQMLNSVGVLGHQTWYIFGTEAGGKKFRYQLDEAGKTMTEQIMVTSSREPGITVEYNGYKTWSKGSGASFWWPEKLIIEGTLVQGRLAVEFKDIIATSPLDPSHFKLSIPSHYHVEAAD